MGSQLRDVCISFGYDPSYAAEVLEKLKNNGWAKVEDYTEFRFVKEIAFIQGLKIRYKEHTGRVVVQEPY